MNIKPNTKIKLLKDVRAFQKKYLKTMYDFQLKHSVIIPRYEVVTVISPYKNDSLLIKNILDEEFIIPSDTLYKIVGKNKEKKEITADVDLADILSLGFGKSDKGGAIKNISGSSIPKGNKVKAIQKMQIITSNVMSTEDLSSLSKLVVAALCANMSVTNGIDASQSTRLQAFCTKLIGSVN